MTRRRLAVSPALLLGLGLALGCAAGEPLGPGDAAQPQHDAGVDVAADVATTEGGGDAAVQPDAAPTDAPNDTAPQNDATQDVTPQADAQHDVGCPDGHTGVNCADCIASLYKCDQECVASCASCASKPATCSSPKQCQASCTGCSGTCVDCPTGQHLCPSGCYPDGTDTIATGCRLTCDGQPCAPPAHATALCTAGACDFTCDAAGHWVKSGAACVCDSAHGFVEQTGTCVCPTGTKECTGTCVAADAAHGCGGASCTACPQPAHSSASCDGGGACVFTCDAAGHWVKNGAGDACVCDTGYTEASGVCCLTAACPGTTYNGHCYWYVSTSTTWDAAEAACNTQCGHLASINDAAEQSFVLGLAGGDSWIGLHDPSTERRSVTADTCTSSDNTISPNGGSYSGDTGDYDVYDNYESCNSYSGYDAIFKLEVQAAGYWVFSLSNSSFDTVLGLYSRSSGSGSTGCIGSQLECDDDDGESTRSLIVRNLAVGQYVLVVDGYNSSAYGSYQFDVRRFVWTDGSPHTYANWKNDGSDDEPNNSGSTEQCVEIYKASGYWNDRTCSQSRAYVCERAF